MKVSIIIPCYNGEKYIQRCLKSIIEQTYSNWEAIIVDDGSNDNTVNIVNGYIQENHKIKLIKQNNSGPSVARNTALKNISGEYLLFVDCDDYIDSKMIENLIYYAKKNNSDIVTCGYYEVKNNKIDKINNFYGDSKCNKNIFFLDSVLLSSGGVVWGKLYKSNIILEKSITFNSDLRMCEDQLFNIDVLNSCKNIYFTDEYYYYYNMCNDESLTKSNNHNNIANQITIQKLLIEKMERLNYDKEYIDRLLGERLFIHIYSFICYSIYNDIDNVYDALNLYDINIFLNKYYTKSIYHNIIKNLMVNKRIKILILTIRFKTLLVDIKNRLRR